MVDGPCSKKYPRAFNNATHADDKRYPIYRRRDVRRVNGVSNQWVVPHNLWLASKYNAHINVEVSRNYLIPTYLRWLPLLGVCPYAYLFFPFLNFLIFKKKIKFALQICSSVFAVKYLYKYVYKGHDRAAVVIEGPNEIQQYFDARYVSASEAAWRLFAFKLHDGFPSVIRLQVHLPDQQMVVFRENVAIQDIVNQEQERQTMLTAYFEANRVILEAREVAYADFPSQFT
jgi:hypothetical protein